MIYDSRSKSRGLGFRQSRKEQSSKTELPSNRLWNGADKKTTQSLMAHTEQNDLHGRKLLV